MMKDIIAVILGGGRGTRLYPLTKERAKPAVPIGGKYRLIDIPISNCLNSTIDKIFILTQFNSESLNKHVIETYRFDNFHKGFVDILAAEQTMESTDWYEGTADAVRKNIKHITVSPHLKYILILSGDQVYQMDYSYLFRFHRKNRADITVSLLPCTRKEASAFGIVKLERDLVLDFVEKPTDNALLESLKSTNLVQTIYPNIELEREFIASMGIYLFNKEILLELLEKEFQDFGKELIPYAIKTKKTAGFLFNKYWEDVGSVGSFLKANIDFISSKSCFDFYTEPVYTRSRHLPPSKLSNTKIDGAFIADRSILGNAIIRHSVIGIRSIVGDNVHIENSLVMGADYYEDATKKVTKGKNRIKIGIGENTVIKNAIIDKNARIGKNCSIMNKNNVDNWDEQNFYIRDKVIVIPKNVEIPDGAKI